MARYRRLITLAAACSIIAGGLRQRSAAEEEPIVVVPPPASFFQQVDERARETARTFYTKYVDVNGLPVVAAAEVSDVALHRAHEIVTHMLAGRPDVLRAMVERGMYLTIIGKDQVYTDLPENRDALNPDYLNERVRGTGGLPTSFGEENLLSLPLDRYDDESIAVHEFCHTIDSALERIDPTWRDRRNRAYRDALDRGLFRDTYAGSNPGEYWAEIAQAYFDCNRVNNWNHGPIGRREQLKVYDPRGYELVRSAFNLAPDQDWRYRWLQPLPNVQPPPAQFHIDPYYTKFTWAREFTVLGREACDQALLEANDIIRKMFAYRHDILKALIADGVRLVVLGPHENVSDLPEYQALAGEDFDHMARYVEYTPQTRILVAAQENVLATSADPYAYGCQIIRAMAKALYHVTATRPVDPDWEKRRDMQQYELRVQRLDARFDEQLRAAYERAVSAGRWQGTPAIHGPVEYWAEGVLAYFDAVGTGMPPSDADHPITTREALRQYDGDLFTLIDQTMAYQGKVDWRRSRQ